MAYGGRSFTRNEELFFAGMDLYFRSAINNMSIEEFLIPDSSPDSLTKKKQKDKDESKGKKNNSDQVNNPTKSESSESNQLSKRARRRIRKNKIIENKSNLNLNESQNIPKENDQTIKEQQNEKSKNEKNISQKTNKEQGTMKAKKIVQEVVNMSRSKEKQKYTNSGKTSNNNCTEIKKQKKMKKKVDNIKSQIPQNRQQNYKLPLYIPATGNKTLEFDTNICTQVANNDEHSNMKTEQHRNPPCQFRNSLENESKIDLTFTVSEDEDIDEKENGEWQIVGLKKKFRSDYFSKYTPSSMSGISANDEEIWETDSFNDYCLFADTDSNYSDLWSDKYTYTKQSNNYYSPTYENQSVTSYERKNMWPFIRSESNTEYSQVLAECEHKKEKERIESFVENKENWRNVKCKKQGKAKNVEQLTLYPLSHVQAQSSNKTLPSQIQNNQIADLIKEGFWSLENVHVKRSVDTCSIQKNYMNDETEIWEAFNMAFQPRGTRSRGYGRFNVRKIGSNARMNSERVECLPALATSRDSSDTSRRIILPHRLALQRNYSSTNNITVRDRFNQLEPQNNESVNRLLFERRYRQGLRLSNYQQNVEPPIVNESSTRSQSNLTLDNPEPSNSYQVQKYVIPNRRRHVTGSCESVNNNVLSSNTGNYSGESFLIRKTESVEDIYSTALFLRSNTENVSTIPQTSLSTNNKRYKGKKDNMTTYDIPERVLHGLKCGLCSEPLSYPPITLSAENGSVCGRCPTLEAENNTQPLREDSYERVASMFNFPCRYTPQGCMEKLPMKNVVTHEQSCTFKPYFCPMLPLGSCAWQGSSTELHGHFAISHQINLLENPMFELNIVTNYKDLYLVPYLGQLFLLRTEFNCSDEIFRFSLHFVGSSESAEKYEYELVFLTSNEDAQWTHPKKQVDTDENILDRKNECTVSLGSLKEILQVPTTITCKLNINVTQEGLCKESSSSNLVNLEENLLEDLYEGAVCEEIEYEDDDDSDEERDIKKAIIDDSVDKMMLDMECPVCQEVMIPPIYQCVVGHSVCDACKPKLKECPTCRNTIANTRNFTLERISENLRYKCKNRIDGCTFETNSSGIRQHEVECKFNPHHCPLHNILNCDWLGKANKIFTHVKSKHPDHFQDNSIFSVPYNSTCVSNESMKIMRVHGEIFKIRFNYSNQMKQVSCTVQFTGPNTEASRFMYEMHVMDMNNTGLQLMSKKYCGASSDDIDDLKHCTMWHLDMVLPFASTENLLKLRCVVTKV